MSRREKTSAVERLFREHYEKTELELPQDIEFREFAYQPFGSETYVRHLSFRTPDEVKSFFTENTPLHLYYSSATYLHPSAEEMEAKEWRGSDLLFDIDADHVKKCIERGLVKRFRVCPECGVVSEDPSTECPGCSGETIEYVEPECLRETELTALDIVEILEEELGIETRYIEVAFSGNRGYHIRVVDERVRSLDREARRVLADYISARGYRGLVREPGKGRVSLPPRLSDGGVRRRIASRLLREVEDPVLRRYMTSTGLLSREVFREIDRSLLRELEEKYPLYAETPIDEMVTIDISRLVRIPNSINGKSGLLAKRVSIDRLGSVEYSIREFSPFGEATAVVEVRYRTPRIRLMDIEFRASTQGLYHVHLPMAVYLELKGLGVIRRVL